MVGPGTANRGLKVSSVNVSIEVALTLRVDSCEQARAIGDAYMACNERQPRTTMQLKASCHEPRSSRHGCHTVRDRRSSGKARL